MLNETAVNVVSDRIIIIGAGVIGAATALALQADGHRVTLVDRQEPCAGASFGNAGVIVNGSCVPTAMPGILLSVLRMASRPLSPLSIRATYALKALPWLMRFVWQSRAAAATANAKHLYALTRHGVTSWRQLTNHPALAATLADAGWLKVYESERSFAATAPARELMTRAGIHFEVLRGGEITDLEPNLAPIFNYAYYQRDCLHITNPERLVQGMVDLFTSRGGEYRQFEVDLVQVRSDKVRVEGSTGVLLAERVVIAAGAWSRTLAQQLGDKVPLETERGYHLMLGSSAGELLSQPVLNGELSFVLSPMESGLRMTGQVEFAGLKAAPDYRHVRNLIPVAKRMLPALAGREESVWMGCRPSLPDSLPVLGFSSQSNRVLYAFGHQHLGMSLGAITGQLIADLVAGREPAVDIHPYRANRF